MGTYVSAYGLTPEDVEVFRRLKVTPSRYDLYHDIDVMTSWQDDRMQAISIADSARVDLWEYDKWRVT